MKSKVLSVLVVLSMIVGLLTLTALVRAQEPAEEAAEALLTPTAEIAAEEAEVLAPEPADGAAAAEDEAVAVEEPEQIFDVPVVDVAADEPVVEEPEAPVADTADEEPAVEEPEQIASESDGLTVSLVASAEEQEAALAMWTRDARRAAKPLSVSLMGGPPHGAADLEELGAAEPGFSSSGKPDPNADAMAQQEFAEEWALAEDLAAADEVEEFGTAGVYTSYLTNYYSQMWQYFPYRTVGKLYFSGGWCSASVISGYNIIVTAAHCLYNTDSNYWYSNWVFVPAERNLAAPYGTFAWSSASVLTNWMSASSSSAGRRYDVAVIKLRNNAAGRPVTYYVGWLGRWWNDSYIQSLHAQGHPSNINSGYYTYTCAAESFYYSTDVMGMGCNMTYGSSGSPWIRVFQPYAWGATNYVNAVTSFGISATWGNTFYGPRFSSSNIVPLCAAQGC